MFEHQRPNQRREAHGSLFEKIGANKRQNTALRFSAKYPPTSSRGIEFLFTGGFAIEQQIGFLRKPFADVDGQFLYEEPEDLLRIAYRDRVDVDTLTRQRNGLKPDAGFWIRAAVSSYINGIKIYLAQPAVIMTLKAAPLQLSATTNGGIIPVLRPPREKDLADIILLRDFWREQKQNDPSWIGFILETLSRLPPESAHSAREILRSLGVL